MTVTVVLVSMYTYICVSISEQKVHTDVHRDDTKDYILRQNSLSCWNRNIKLFSQFCCSQNRRDATQLCVKGVHSRPKRKYLFSPNFGLA